MLRNFDDRSLVMNSPASRRPDCGVSFRTAHTVQYRLGRLTHAVHVRTGLRPRSPVVRVARDREECRSRLSP